MARSTNPTAEAHRDLLKDFFDDTARFKFHSLVAHGIYGSACRIKYHDPKGPALTNFLVKMSFPGKYHIDAMKTEKEYLKKMQANRHIVQLVDIPDNPLEDPLLNEDVDPDSWIIMEWLDHGTIGEFLMTAIAYLDSRGQKLPNRLLWRFFLCLIRGAIAMAWPDKRENVDDAVEESGIVHNDLHLNNVLMGAPPQDDEHTITPILKIIDFGCAGQIPSASASTGVQKNIYDLGNIMATLIALDDTDPRGRLPNPPKFTRNGVEMSTDCEKLVPAPAGVDPQLVELVCACTASDFNNRPTLPHLLAQASAAVRDRGVAFYNNNPNETDEKVKNIWQQLTMSGPYADPTDA